MTVPTDKCVAADCWRRQEPGSVYCYRHKDHPPVVGDATGNRADSSATHLNTGEAPPVFGALLRRLVGWYVTIGGVYFLWALVVLQFRECGAFGATCDWTVDTSGELVLGLFSIVGPLPIIATAILAFARAVVWLPNLVLALIGASGASLGDWLWLRDVPPMYEFLANLGAVLP